MLFHFPFFVNIVLLQLTLLACICIHTNSVVCMIIHALGLDVEKYTHDRKQILNNEVSCSKTYKNRNSHNLYMCMHKQKSIHIYKWTLHIVVYKLRLVFFSKRISPVASWWYFLFPFFTTINTIQLFFNTLFF